jgi:hypothetical protein
MKVGRYGGARREKTDEVEDCTFPVRAVPVEHCPALGRLFEFE